MKKIKLTAIISASGGIGSHLILHKMQGHKNIVTLKEVSFTSQGGTSRGDLKNFMSKGHLPGVLPVRELYGEQLFPKKEFDSNVEWLVLNKPPLKRINYQRVFHPEIPVLYIFKNPMSLYYTWIRKWKEYGDSRYQKNVPDKQIFDWLKVTLMASLYELAQNFDNSRDNIISLEHFINDSEAELERIFNCLDVPVIKDLETINTCNKCGTEKIEVKKMSLRSGREEEVMYCHRHGAVLGPGEYNYIRKEDPSFLNNWKNKKDFEEISDKFRPLFGDEIVDYYLNERYLSDKNRSEFDSLMKSLLGGLKI